MELMKDLFGQIEASNEAAAKAEIKMLAYLERQTNLQEQSVANERQLVQLLTTLADKMT
jgi:hypothetical protein